MIRVKDLPDPADHYIGNTYHKGPSLYCLNCHNSYSANRADYFLAHPDTILECCGEPMILAKEERRLVEIRH